MKDRISESPLLRNIRPWRRPNDYTLQITNDFEDRLVFDSLLSFSGREYSYNGSPEDSLAEVTSSNPSVIDDFVKLLKDSNCFEDTY